jgi:enediyne biosynthesis protein E3
MNRVFRCALTIKPSNIDLIRLGFEIDSAHPQGQHLQLIANTFASGFNSVVNEFTDTCNEIDSSFRGFFQEGAAMAYALSDSLFLRKKQQLMILDFMRQEPDYCYLHHVGIGWAFAKIPWARAILFKQLDPLLCWLALDGWGFHDTFFNKKRALNVNFPIAIKGNARDIYCQGVGRALWFVKGSDPIKINQYIRLQKKNYQPALWSGVGLAATYAGYHCANDESLILLKRFSGQYLKHLQQGVVFAAQAASHGQTDNMLTRRTCEVLTGHSIELLSEICKKSKKLLPKSASADTYQLWRKKISDNFSEVSNNES